MRLESLFSPDQLLYNEPMSLHTTFRVGGKADVVALPDNEAQLIAALDMARESGVPCVVIGNGSNLLVRDGGIRGLVIVLGERFAEIHIEGDRLTAQAGASLARVAAAAQAAGLTGLEFSSGIPGTLGGGCAMNAGAYGGQLSDVLVEARVLLNGQVMTLGNEEMQMSYRTTRPLRQGGIVLGAAFQLEKGDREAIAATMRDLNGRRRDKQPFNYPSAGSTFKRPTGYFAGALIEQAGLKGYAVGGAQVSEKHAGFVINKGNATARDILDLMAHVTREVERMFGVTLEPEVRILGED